MNPPAELTQRRRLLFTMLTALAWRYPDPSRPSSPGWPGIGRIVAGMSRQGHDLQLARHGAEGWLATFYPAGLAYSQTAAVGAAGHPEPWTAVQRAAWEGLWRREGEAG